MTERIVQKWPDRLRELLAGPRKGAEKHWAAVRVSLEGLLPDLQSIAHRHRVVWLVREIQQLSELPGVMVEPATAPGTGMIGPHPLFSALAQQPHNSTPATGRRAQAFLLTACAVREPHTVKYPTASAIEKAGLSVRKLLKADVNSDRIQDILSQSSDLTEFRNSAEELLHAIHDLTDAELLVVRDLHPLLKYVEEGGDWRTRRSAKRRGSSKRSIILTPTTGEAAKGYGIILGRLPKEVRSSRTSRALSAEIEGSRPAAMTSNTDSLNPQVPASKLSDRQAHFRIITRARAIKAGNQPTPIRRDAVHTSALLSLEEKARQEVPQIGKTNIESIEPFIALIAMLLLGADGEQLHQIRVSPDLDQFGGNSNAPATIIPSSGTIMLYVPEIPQGWEPPSSVRGHFRPVTRFIALRIPTDLALGQALQSHAAVVHSGFLFSSPHQTAGKAEPDATLLHSAQDCLTKINEIRRTNLTLPRLSGFLEREIVLMQGDFAESELLSCRLQGAMDTRRYYYAPKAATLADRYDAVWNPLREAAQTSKSTSLELPHQFSSEAPYVGSRATPTTSAARVAIESMQEELSKLTKGRPSQERLRRRHNGITAYVTWQIFWMTGMRPVIDPIEIDLYDHTRGLLAVSDKDTRDEYAGRLVWFPPPVQQQVRIYQELASETSDALFGNAEIDIAFRIINPDFEVKPIGQKTPKAILRAWYPFPENAHRHYLRTRLRELGVDGGIVDALLGHSDVGHEPYARHSALAPMQLIEALKKPLSTIWDELRWKVLPGKRL